MLSAATAPAWRSCFPQYRYGKPLRIQLGRASYGLLLKEIYDAEIRNNVFLENTIGIYVEGSTRIRTNTNEFNYNGWVIKMSGGCPDNEVNANNFLHNTFDLSLNSAPNNNSFRRQLLDRLQRI